MAVAKEHFRQIIVNVIYDLRMRKMNEQAIRLEEKIINLFSNLEAELYQG